MIKDFYPIPDSENVLVISGRGLMTGKCWLMEIKFGPFGLISGDHRDICEIEHQDH